jgi:glycosyltransferase involved in cell wall biosynthesis
MRILSVCVRDNTNNSAGIRIFKMAELLTSAGHDVEFVFYLTKESENLQNMNIPYKYSVVHVSKFTIYIKHLIKVINGNYDILYCNLNHTTFTSILTKLIDKPIIYDRHGDIVQESILGKRKSYLSSIGHIITKLIESIELKISNRVICVSHSMIKNLNDKGVPLKKLKYVTNGTDLNFFKPLPKEEKRTEMGISPQKMIFGYIGAFDKWQGIEKFIELSKLINEDNILFLMVGGEETYKTDNLIAIPKVEKTEVPDYYAICDVLVLPRPKHLVTEVAAPTKFAEYVAMGKPVLTTPVGDAAKLVSEYKCGIVTESDSVESLLKGALELKNISKNELDDMGQNSRKLAEKEFNFKKMKNDLLDSLNIN